MFDDDTAAVDGAMAPTMAGAAGDAGRGRFRHYKDGALLGRGGMGEVVSAEDPQIGRSVAIKRSRSREPALVARFVREAKIQAQLEHPAIVPVHEIGVDDDGAPVIVMKQIRGTTLADVLRDGNAPRQRLLRAFVEVCLAIELAHARGIVHRDLKPANIALGDFGEVYVLDWGLARLPGDDDAGQVMGTPGYMPPEQERGDADLDARADVFALGRVLRDVLGDADAPELSAAATKACAADRADRFPSARALAEIVERVLDGDRDLAQRRKLAQQLLADARAASHRRDQIRAAGRALALDPENRDAAGLVAQLMLEPPAQTPPEVEAEIADEELRTIEAQRRFTIGTNLAALGLMGMYYWVGLRDPAFYAFGVAIVIATSVFRYFAVVDGKSSRPLVVALVASLIAGNVWASVYVTPLIALPFAMLVTVRNVMQPRLTPPRLMWLAMLAGLVIPFVVVQTITTSGGDLVLHLSSTPLDSTAVTVWICAFLAIVLTTIYATSQAAADMERAARRRVHLQAWQLRQLVG